MTGPTILVVDDDAASVEVLVQRLQAMSFATDTATNGPEAIARVKASAPDVILLDVSMPGMDGFEVCRALQSDPETASIPVIFLSARKTLDDRTTGLLLGARDYLVKPLVPAELAQRVTAAARDKVQADAMRPSRSYVERDQLVDPLTRVLNRRGLQSHLLQEVSRARRYATPLSCLMLAGDNFAAIADGYGHAHADDALHELAATLVACCRPTDFVARYRGDEFTVLLPHTQREGALACAERIRRGIVAQNPGGLATASLGVAEFASTEDGHSLLERADSALYEARAAGGNCVRGA